MYIYICSEAEIQYKMNCDICVTSLHMFRMVGSSNTSGVCHEPILPPYHTESFIHESNPLVNCSHDNRKEEKKKRLHSKSRKGKRTKESAPQRDMKKTALIIFSKYNSICNFTPTSYNL